ncbi:hypothetical protein ACFXPJ_26585 [Streptomyces goshikiensis]
MGTMAEGSSDPVAGRGGADAAAGRIPGPLGGNLLRHAHRNARDYERLVQHCGAPITWAAITLITLRIAQKEACP